MSGFPKMLWQITVPAGDWDFGFNDGAPRVATVTVATYDSILTLAPAVATAMNAVSAVNFTATVSSIGTVAITGDAAWNTAWGTTDAGLSAALGYAETEAVAGNVLTGTLQHGFGYYPGTMSYGRSADRGVGLTRPLCWEPDYHEVRTVAGNMVTRSVAASTPQETCELACGLIKCDSRIGANEWSDATYGVRAWLDACVSLPFRLYPDRALGTVGAVGTAGTTYYNCAFAGRLRRHDGPHPSYCSWSVPINRESSP